MVGYVVEGSVLSAMNDREKKVFQKGESWYEPPGCYHRISDNNSTTDPAVITVSYMIRTAVIEEKGVKVLVEVDPEYIDGAKEQMKNWEEKQK